MAKPKSAFNPFYLLAMLFGLAFTLTACAFGVMMMRSVRPEGLPRAGEPGFGLMDLLSRRGTAILAAEVAGLAVFAVAAIALDHFRGRREVARRSREAAGPQRKAAVQPPGSGGATPLPSTPILEPETKP